MDYLLLALAVLLVFVIGAVVVGREARRLDSVAPRALYDLDEAVAYVADHIPEASQARLTPHEVLQLLRIHMGRIHDLGLQPGDVTDRRQDIAVPTFLEEVDEVAYVIGGAEVNDLDVADEDVVAVVEAHLGYLEAIGAVGPPAAADEDA